MEKVVDSPSTLRRIRGLGQGDRMLFNSLEQAIRVGAYRCGAGEYLALILEASRRKMSEFR